MQIIMDREFYPLNCRNTISENYLISKNGIVYSLFKKIFLKQHVSQGYQQVRLLIDKKGINETNHRLVAYTFLNLQYGDGTVVNHKDGNKSNNELENLEVVTPGENTRHAIKVLKCKKYGRKIIQYDRKMNELKEFDSIAECAKELGLKESTVSMACQHERFCNKQFYFRYKEETNHDNPPFNYKDLDFLPNYRIYENGIIWSMISNKKLSPEFSYEGYGRVTIKDKKYCVSHLVGKAFLEKGTPDQKYINHKDKDPTNNHYLNLEWCTHQENIIHSNIDGTRFDVNSKPCVKKSLDGKILKKYKSASEAARVNNIGQTCISKACRKNLIYKGFLWEYTKK